MPTRVQHDKLEACEAVFLGDAEVVAERVLVEAVGLGFCEGGGVADDVDAVVLQILVAVLALEFVVETEGVAEFVGGDCEGELV